MDRHRRGNRPHLHGAQRCPDADADTEQTHHPAPHIVGRCQHGHGALHGREPRLRDAAYGQQSKGQCVPRRPDENDTDQQHADRPQHKHPAVVAQFAGYSHDPRPSQLSEAVGGDQQAHQSHADPKMVAADGRYELLDGEGQRVHHDRDVKQPQQHGAFPSVAHGNL